MGKVYINGREAVHKGCGGRAIAFPDVCLCPPGPPAGPVPVPLTNTVQAKDLVNGAMTVLFEGNPAGHRDSYFDSSTGNEVSRSTGGGIVSHAVQGKAYFASWSPNVFIAGKPAVRHGDLLTQNHLGKLPANTPPSVWMSSVSPDQPPVQPKTVTKILHEGKEWIEIEMVDLEGEVVPFEDYSAKTPAGESIEGRGLLAGFVAFRGLAKGNCQIVFPDIDADPTSPDRKPSDKIDAGPSSRGKRSKADKIYFSGKPLLLATGKKYRVELPRRPSYWLELTIKKREAEPQGCAYVLRSTDGTYEVRRTLSDDISKNEGLLVLQFPDLMADKNYTLTHKLGKDGASRVLFHDRPYDKLRTRVQDLEASQPEPTETAIDGVTDELQRAHSARLQENLADDEVSGEDMLPGFEAPE